MPTGATPSTQVAPVAAAAVGTVECTHCGSENPADALFCEQCGYDFTTGQAPPPDPAVQQLAPPSSVAAVTGWVAEISADGEWYAAKATVGTEPLPTDQPSRVVVLSGTTALIGRASASRGVHPEIDAGEDSAVSRRHAQLVRGDDGWQVVDLDSTNGTALARAGGPLPDDTLERGQPAGVGDGDSVLVGAWTRITLRLLEPPPTEASNQA